MKLRAANQAYTTLDGDYNASATEITLIDASDFPDDGPFVATVNDEIILFESRTDNVCTVATTDGTLEVDGRGYDGSVASTHASGDTIANKVVACYINNLWDELSLNSTGGTINGDTIINGTLTVNSSASTESNAFTGDVSITGDVAIVGNLTVSGATAGLDFNGSTLTDLNIKAYTETAVAVSPSTAKVLTLDMSLGNNFFAQLSTAVGELVISNASTVNLNSMTLQLFLNANYSTGFYFAWQTPYAVASTTVSINATTSDGSFNSTGLFATGVRAGDIISVTGFSTAKAANNAEWRIKSATASKLTIGDGSTLMAKSTNVTGISISRRKEYFIATEVPDAPEPYVPKTFTGYSTDGDRWKIVEVGEF